MVLDGQGLKDETGELLQRAEPKGENEGEGTGVDVGMIGGAREGGASRLSP